MSVFSLVIDQSLSAENKAMQVYSSLVKVFLGVGDFVVVDVFSDGHEVAGQILDIASLVTSIPESERDESIPEHQAIILVRIFDIVTTNTLNTEPIPDKDKITTWRIREVMETDAGFWITPSDAKNIEFICHIDDIKNDRYGCLNGIFNLFFARYSSITGTPILLPASFNQFLHLTKVHLFSYRIFHTTLDLIGRIGNIFLSCIPTTK